jgi:hypothetical protein
MQFREVHLYLRRGLARPDVCHNHMANKVAVEYEVGTYVLCITLLVHDYLP